MRVRYIYKFFRSSFINLTVRSLLFSHKSHMHKYFIRTVANNLHINSLLVYVLISKALLISDYFDLFLYMIYMARSKRDK